MLIIGYFSLFGGIIELGYFLVFGQFVGGNLVIVEIVVEVLEEMLVVKDMGIFFLMNNLKVKVDINILVVLLGCIEIKAIELFKLQVVLIISGFLNEIKDSGVALIEKIWNNLFELELLS